MRIGVPKESKNHEYRVSITPAGVRELRADGHQILLQSGAGDGAGYSDNEYRKAGACVEEKAELVFAESELIIKVKEPQPFECEWLQADQILFTYLHLAAAVPQAQRMLERNVSAIAYETIQDAQGQLPLLAPMSEIAGRLSVLAGAYHLQSVQGGAGVLCSGVAGVAAANVVVVGGGVVGSQAARMALGLGAKVTVVDVSLAALRRLDDQYGGRVATVYSTQEALERLLTGADLVIGAVLVPGAATPKVLTRDMIKRMPNGAVLCDVAIDQGGCSITSHATSHDEPTYIDEGIVHYCVANMPGAVARTATAALSHATLPYIRRLASERLQVLQEPGFAAGLNLHQGRVTHPGVAEALCMPYHGSHIASQTPHWQVLQDIDDGRNRLN